MKIAPSIGRKVWFYPCPDNQHEYNVIDSDQALDATVLFVHGEDRVNLLVVDHKGHPHYVDRVWLAQPDIDVRPGDQDYAEWMPFQIGSAKAYQDEQKQHDKD